MRKRYHAAPLHATERETRAEGAPDRTSPFVQPVTRWSAHPTAPSLDTAGATSVLGRKRSRAVVESERDETLPGRLSTLPPLAEPPPPPRAPAAKRRRTTLAHSDGAAAPATKARPAARATDGVVDDRPSKRNVSRQRRTPGAPRAPRTVPGKHVTETNAALRQVEEWSRDPLVWIGFTDGSCKPNPGYAGAACVVLRPGSTSLADALESHCSFEALVSNNVSELTAIQLCLDVMAHHAPSRTAWHILTDSSYSVNMLQKGWNANANAELIDSLRQQIERLKHRRQLLCLTLHWIPGHTSIAGNIRADELANLGAHASRRKTVVPPRYAPGSHDKLPMGFEPEPATAVAPSAMTNRPSLLATAASAGPVTPFSPADPTKRPAPSHSRPVQEPVANAAPRPQPRPRLSSTSASSRTATTPPPSVAVPDVPDRPQRTQTRVSHARATEPPPRADASASRLGSPSTSADQTRDGAADSVDETRIVDLAPSAATSTTESERRWTEVHEAWNAIDAVESDGRERALRASAVARRVIGVPGASSRASPAPAGASHVAWMARVYARGLDRYGPTFHVGDPLSQTVVVGGQTVPFAHWMIETYLAIRHSFTQTLTAESASADIAASPADEHQEDEQDDGSIPTDDDAAAAADVERRDSPNSHD